MSVAQARHRCGYSLTQEAVVGTPVELDHLVPEALGGRTVEDNLRLACSLYNSFKGSDISSLDAVTRKLTPLFNPRRQVGFPEGLESPPLIHSHALSRSAMS